MNHFALQNPFNDQKAPQHLFPSQSSYSQPQYDPESQIRHSDVSEDFKMEYTPFDNLRPLPLGQDMMQVFEKLKEEFESSDWITQFCSIDTLRSLNKHFPQEVNFLFQAFGAYIQSSLFSFKTCIVKNILLFVTEVLAMSKGRALNAGILVHLVEILVPKTASSSKIIRPVAEGALQFLVANFLCDETIRALCLASATKNKVHNQKAFFYLTTALDLMKETIANVHGDTLRTIFQCMAFTLSAKCAQNKTYAKSILNYLNELMGAQNFMNYIRFLYDGGSLGIQHAEILAKVVEGKEFVRPSLAMELRHRRSMNPSGIVVHEQVYVEINRQSYVL